MPLLCNHFLIVWYHTTFIMFYPLSFAAKMSALRKRAYPMSLSSSCYIFCKDNHIVAKNSFFVHHMKMILDEEVSRLSWTIPSKSIFNMHWTAFRCSCGIPLAWGPSDFCQQLHHISEKTDKIWESPQLSAQMMKRMMENLVQVLRHSLHLLQKKCWIH